MKMTRVEFVPGTMKCGNLNIKRKDGEKMKIPQMLDDYLAETEQDSESMSAEELFEEANWVLSQYKVGEYYDNEYTARDAATLKAFITRISAKMARR